MLCAHKQFHYGVDPDIHHWKEKEEGLGSKNAPLIVRGFGVCPS